MTFLQTRRRLLLSLLLVAATLTALIFRFTASREGRRINDFFQAEFELQQLTRGEAESGAAFGRLQNILQRHGELHQKYDGVIAQSMLKQEKVDLGRPFAEQVLERTPESLVAYSTFTQTTLTIARKEYEAALAQARTLQAQITSGELLSGRALILHNLIRIAFLCEELQKGDEECLAWLEVVKACEMDLQEDPLTQARDEIVTSFEIGQITILDYAKARIETLTS